MSPPSDPRPKGYGGAGWDGLIWSPCEPLDEPTLVTALDSEPDRPAEPHGAHGETMSGSIQATSAGRARGAFGLGPATLPERSVLRVGLARPLTPKDYVSVYISVEAGTITLAVGDNDHPDSEYLTAQSTVTTAPLS